MLASTRLASSLRPCAGLPARCTRALATSSASNGSNSVPESSSLPGFVADSGSRAGSSRQSRVSYKVETQKIAGSPAECLFILNALEKKFGAASLFRFQRNLDFPSQYAPYFVANFHDHPDLPKLGGDETTVAIEVPKKLIHKPLETALNGGVGLKDIQPYLYPGSPPTTTLGGSQVESTAEAAVEGDVHSAVSESSVDHTVVNVKIACMGESYEYRSVDRKSTASRDTQDNIGRTFVRWGGFASSATAEEEAPHMQSAIGHWRGVLGPVNFKQMLDERVDMAATPTVTAQDSKHSMPAESPEEIFIPTPEPAPVIQTSTVQEAESWVPQTSLSELFPMPPPGTRATPSKAPQSAPTPKEPSKPEGASKASHASSSKPTGGQSPKTVKKAKPASPPPQPPVIKAASASSPAGRKNIDIKPQPPRRPTPPRPATPKEDGPGVLTKMRDFFGL